MQISSFISQNTFTKIGSFVMFQTMWDCMSHILLRALCSNEPKFFTLSWVKIYTYICIYTRIQIYVLVYIYTHLWCGFSSEPSKIIILMQNHNLADTLSKPCDLFGKEGLNFLNLQQNPKVSQFGSGRKAGCVANTLHSCSNENTEHLSPQSQESPCSLYSTEVFQSVLYTCIF